MSDEKKAEVQKIERELASLRVQLSVKLQALKDVPGGIEYAVEKSPRKDLEIIQAEQSISDELKRLQECLIDAVVLTDFFSDAINLIQQAQSTLNALDRERDIKAANAAKKALEEFNENVYDLLIDINRDESKIPECTDELLQKLMIKDDENNVLRHLNRDEIALWKAALDQQNSWNPFAGKDKIGPAKLMIFRCLTDTKLHMTAEIEKHSGRDIERQQNVAKNLMTDLSSAQQAATEFQQEIKTMISERQQKLNSFEKTAKKSVTPTVNSAPITPVQRAAKSVSHSVDQSGGPQTNSNIRKEKSSLNRLLDKISRGIDSLLAYCKSLKPSTSSSLLKGLGFSLNKKAKSSHNLEMEPSNPTFESQVNLERTEEHQAKQKPSSKSQPS